MTDFSNIASGGFFGPSRGTEPDLNADLEKQLDEIKSVLKYSKELVQSQKINLLDDEDWIREQVAENRDFIENPDEPTPRDENLLEGITEAAKSEADSLAKAIDNHDIEAIKGLAEKYIDNPGQEADSKPEAGDETGFVGQINQYISNIDIQPSFSDFQPSFNDMVTLWDMDEALAAVGQLGAVPGKLMNGVKEYIDTAAPESHGNEAEEEPNKPAEPDKVPGTATENAAVLTMQNGELYVEEGYNRIKANDLHDIPDNIQAGPDLQEKLNEQALKDVIQNNSGAGFNNDDEGTLTIDGVKLEIDVHGNLQSATPAEQPELAAKPSVSPDLLAEQGNLGDHDALLAVDQGDLVLVTNDEITQVNSIKDIPVDKNLLPDEALSEELAKGNGTFANVDLKFSEDNTVTAEPVKEDPQIAREPAAQVAEPGLMPT